MAYRLSKEELDEQFEQFLKESLSDDSFGNNKKSAVLENLGKPIAKRTKKKETLPWWAADEDSDDGDLARTSRSFIKSQSTSQPIEEVEEENPIEEMQQSTQDPLITSIERDSLEMEESVMAYGPNRTSHVGLDTLEEQDEKERFFARLEKGASSTIDYSRLNKELDSTDSTQLTALNCNNETQKTEYKENKELSANYSEDFDDDPESMSLGVRNSEEHEEPNDAKLNALQQKEENQGMLAKVALLDSMDSTMDTQKILRKTQDEGDSVTQQQTNEAAAGTGISNQYTNSDVEALHKAYQNLDKSLEDTDELNNFLKTTDHAIASFGDTVDSTEKNFQKILTGESDMSTVDELMQRIKGEQSSDAASLSLLEQGHTDLLLSKPPNLQEKKDIDFLEGMLLNNSPKDTYNQYSSKRTENQNTLYQRLASRGASSERKGQNESTSGLHSINMVKSPPSVLKRNPSSQYSYVKSSGYGKNSIPMKANNAADRSQSRDHIEKKENVSPYKKLKHGILSSTRTIRFAEETSTSSAQLHEDSAHNFYGAIPENKSALREIGASDLSVLQRLQNVEEKLNAGYGQASAFKEDLSKKDEEFKLQIENLKMNYEEEIGQLKQEKYMLESQLHSADDKLNKRSALLGDKKDPITDEKVQEIRQEIEEQETLLKGYQQENERLYQQVKELQQRNKHNEERMFKENQALKADLITLREKLSGTQANNHLTSHEGKPSDQSFAELSAELRALQKRESRMLEDIAKYKQEKQALEVDLVQMKKECDRLKAQASNISDDKSYEMKMMEESHKQEIRQLNKRLQWFAENQEILDKDAARLKDAYEQIEKLTFQVEKLAQDAGNQSAQQQKRLKDRAADAKRIQDLERQVKEMEAVIKRRHPNSIPAIMCAAALVPDTESTAKSNTVSFLERRIQTLESQLEGKDEDAKKSLRSMEQQFQKIKIQYESRIKELEELLTQTPSLQPQNPLENTIKVKALEQELSIFKDAHHTTVMKLQKEIETLKEKNVFLENKENTKFNETDQIRLTKLNQELIAKSNEIQELSRTVEKLQKERMLFLSSKPNLSSNDGRHNAKSGPEAPFEKLYKPDAFTDSQMTDLVQENERLRNVIQNLSQEINQQKSKCEASLAQGEEIIKRLKAEHAEQNAALKHSHQKDIERLICQQAMEHSSSRVAELSSKLAMQEVQIKHLQNQLTDLQKDKESLAILRVREETLQKEITKLLDELKTARESHSPEMKHFLKLESKIKQMEARHSQREQELQQIIQQTRHAADSTQARETDKWRKLVQQKNMEIKKFRSELDAILEVLRVLQRQGIVVPTTALESSDIYWQP